MTYKDDQDMFFQRLRDLDDQILFAFMRSVIPADVDPREADTDIMAFYVAWKNEAMRNGLSAEEARAEAHGGLTYAVKHGHLTWVPGDGLNLRTPDGS